jgi:hypothetical protein
MGAYRREKQALFGKLADVSWRAYYLQMVEQQNLICTLFL